MYLIQSTISNEQSRQQVYFLKYKVPPEKYHNVNRNLVQEMEEAINISLEKAQELVNKHVIPLLKDYENKNPRLVDNYFMKG